MTLTELAKLLEGCVGSGYPAYFQTPDGKTWDVKRVIATQTFVTPARDGEVTTLVELAPVTQKQKKVVRRTSPRPLKAAPPPQGEQQ